MGSSEENSNMQCMNVIETGCYLIGLIVMSADTSIIYI